MEIGSCVANHMHPNPRYLPDLRVCRKLGRRSPVFRLGGPEPHIQGWLTDYSAGKYSVSYPLLLPYNYLTQLPSRYARGAALYRQSHAYYQALGLFHIRRPKVRAKSRPPSSTHHLHVPSPHDETRAIHPSSRSTANDSPSRSFVSAPPSASKAKLPPDVPPPEGPGSRKRHPSR